MHKICGEFLSGEALGDLRTLGIDVADMGAAPITAMRLVHRGRVAAARLPFAAAGLSRFALDEALLRRAAALGADVQRGVRVRSAEPGAVQTDAGTLTAKTLLLATGKHDVRGVKRDAPEAEALIGFKLHLRLRPEQMAALAGHVEVVLFDRGYAGLQWVEGGVANLCLLVDRARYDAVGQDWPSLLAALAREDSHLARRLDGAAWCWERPLSIFRVPYGFVHRGPEQAGVFRLGDQGGGDSLVLRGWDGDRVAQRAAGGVGDPERRG